MAKNNTDQQLVNLQAAQLAAQVANWAAQLEFQKERLKLLELPQFQATTEAERQRLQVEIDRLAFDKAEAEYKRALSEASLTGTYKGQPTMEWLTQQAKMTGVLNGQQTLEGKLTDAQIAQMNAQMAIQSKQMELEYQKFGFDKDRWATEFAYGQQNDLRNFLLSEAGITGVYNGQQTLEAKRLDSSNALAYLDLLTRVQSNPFKTLRVQQNAGNFNNLAQGFLGKFEMAGQTGVTGNPGQANPGDMLTQILPDGTEVPVGGAPQVPTAPIPQPGGLAPITGGVSGPGAPVSPTQPGNTYTTMAAGQAVAAPQVGAVGAEGVAASMPFVYGTAQQIPVTQQVTATSNPGGVAAPPSLDLNVPYTYSPPGTQAPVEVYNYNAGTSGQTQVYPPGVSAPPSQGQVSTTTPQTIPGEPGKNPVERSPWDPATLPGQVNKNPVQRGPYDPVTTPGPGDKTPVQRGPYDPVTTQPRQPSQPGAVGAAGSNTVQNNSLLTPDKVNAKNYANADAGQQKLLWQWFEDQGWDPETAKSVFQKTLPRYGGPASGSVKRVA